MSTQASECTVSHQKLRSLSCLCIFFSLCQAMECPSKTQPLGGTEGVINVCYFYNQDLIFPYVSHSVLDKLHLFLYFLITDLYFFICISMREHQVLSCILFVLQIRKMEARCHNNLEPQRKLSLTLHFSLGFLSIRFLPLQILQILAIYASI